MSLVTRLLSPVEQKLCRCEHGAFAKSMYSLSDHTGRVVYGMNCIVRSNTGIVDSNPTQGMDVCLRLFCVCVVVCVGSGLASG
jgi:hypothetical protein